MIAGLRGDAWLRRNPPQPGRFIRTGYLEGNDYDYAGMTLGEAARKLGVSRATLSRVVNGHTGISAEMALKLEEAGWGTADSWMQTQANYELTQARKRMGQWPNIEKLNIEKRTVGGDSLAVERDKARVVAAGA